MEDYNVLHISLQNNRIKVNFNKFSHAILSAIAPFICVYYQLATTLNKTVSIFVYNQIRINFLYEQIFLIKQLPADSLEEVPLKTFLKIMQQRIESILNVTNPSQLLHVHPYCLALDNLNIAIHALVQGSYLERNRETGNLILNSSKTDALIHLEKLLLRYCNLMPFKKYYHHNTIASKL